MIKKDNNSIVIKFSIIWFFIAMIIFILILSFYKSNIFATNTTLEEDNTDFEENQNIYDVIQIMLDNTNSNKKMVNEQRDVEFKIEYEENPNLPKDEEQVKQEGKIGKIQVTAIQEFQNEEMINEEILESKTIEEVISKVIYRGTSEFLKKFSVHIDDKMYLLEAEDLKKEAKEDSETLINIPRYLNVILKEAGEEWIKISYNGQVGFIKTTNITSEAVNPMIKEKNRIAILKNKLNIDMDLSIPSGLTLSDYKTIFAGNLNDKNNIFEQNATYFYEAEQRYKINGVFLAAIGIHESAWGTSKLAIEKKNLFGYKAYDRDPYNSAQNFETYENTINTVAEALASNYLNVYGTKITDNLTAKGTYFNGTTVKDVNVRYASDTSWGEKVYKYMEYLYNKL